MRYDYLLEPISDTEPCGPDLDELGDNKYLNFVLGADSRFPEQFFDPGTGKPFDRSSLKLPDAVGPIPAFLDESRDLRLLTLDARFQILAGQIEPFVDAVQAMAALLRERWDDVHPRGFEGDYTLRQNTVGAIDDRRTVVLPLQYATILRDVRQGSISLRDFMLADGKAAAREDERVLDAAELREILQSEANRAAIEAAHATLTACRQALTSMENSFAEKTDYQYTVSFDLVRETLSDILRFIETGRPDLGGTQVEAASGEASSGDAADTGAAEPSALGGGAPVFRVIVPTGPVTTQSAAKAALLAAETYYGRYEPSSPALLLVHQARILVGQPMVAALESLLPDTVDTATMTIDGGLNFALNITKLRAIAEDYTSTAETPPEDEEVPEFTATSRAEALGLISACAAFFRIMEPSSPIPMLLSRAERFSTQTFQSILAELIPKPAY